MAKVENTAPTAPTTAPTTTEPDDVTALRARVTMLEAVVATLVRQRTLDIAAGRVPRMSRDTMLAEWMAGR